MQDDMHGKMGPMMAKMKGGAAAKLRALYSTPMKTFVIANVGVMAASNIATSRAHASPRNSQGAS